MSREQLEKLLGGYATGILTPEERRALAEGALEHQEIFDQLVREEALREALDDPAARAQLLAVLGEPRRSWWSLIVRPAALAPAAAALLVAGYFALRPPTAPPPPQMARVYTPPPAATAAVQEPKPAPPAARPRPFKPKPEEKAAVPPEAMPEPPVQVAASRPPSPPAGVAAPAPPPETTMGAVTQSVELPPAMSFTAEDSAPRRRQRPGPALLSRTAATLPQQLTWFAAKRGVDGSFVPLTPGESLRTGDAIRLVLRPATSGHLAVWQRDDSGGRRILFSGRVQFGTSYIVPPEGALRYDTPGARFIHARLSAVEEPPTEAGSVGIRLEFR